MRFSAVCFMSFLLTLSSCVDAKQELDLSDSYKTDIEPLFLESYPNTLCKVWIEIDSSDLEQTLLALWSNKDDLDFFVLGARKIPQTALLVASEEICEPPRTEGRLFEELGSIIGEFSFSSNPERVELVDTDARLDSLGLFDLRDSRPTAKPGVEVCTIETERKEESGEVLLIRPDDISTFRYVLGIPIVYYSESDGTEILSFDDGCMLREDYLELIDKFTNSKLN